VRHRLLAATLKEISGLTIEELGRGKRVLHFAPERTMRSLFSAVASQYVSADLSGYDVDLPLDICDMASVEDGAFDLVIACDVLEHVTDDDAGLNEMRRVLANAGWAIVTVPQKDGLPSKYEDARLQTDEARRHAFGQRDHVRIYGDDFDSFMEAHGFAVTPISEQAFPAFFAAYHVLYPPRLSNHPLATNHRKVYFCQKAPHGGSA
jgi:SAM-dependent methyltransferase